MALKSPHTQAEEYFLASQNDAEREMYEKTKNYTVYVENWTVCSCYHPHEVVGNREEAQEMPLYMFEWAKICNRNPFHFSGDYPTKEPQKTVCDQCYEIIHFSDGNFEIPIDKIRIVEDDEEHSYSAAGMAFWIEKND